MSQDLRSILQDLIPEVIYTWVRFATGTKAMSTYIKLNKVQKKEVNLQRSAVNVQFQSCSSQPT